MVPFSLNLEILIIVLLSVLLIIYSSFMLYKFNIEQNELEKDRIEFTHNFLFGIFGVFPLFIIILGGYFGFKSFNGTFSSNFGILLEQIKTITPFLLGSASALFKK
jgi:C4-dicarboxylate transporter